jgi:hypothetical protein
MDVFSLFISLSKFSNEKDELPILFDAMHRFSGKNGVLIKNQHLCGKDQIVFDLSADGKIMVEGCDLQCVSNETESILIFGANESELRTAGLFDEKNRNCFIVQLALFLFLKGSYQLGLVATEDTLTSLALKAFYPGYWTIFADEPLPEFLRALPLQSLKSDANIYRFDQLTEIGLTPEQTGREIRKWFKTEVLKGGSR